MIVSEQSSSTFYEERGIHIRGANYEKQYPLMWRTLFNADVYINTLLDTLFQTEVWKGQRFKDLKYGLI